MALSSLALSLFVLFRQKILVQRSPAGPHGQRQAIHDCLHAPDANDSHHTVVLCKPLEHVNKDHVWFAEAPLLKGGVEPYQNGIKEVIGEGSIHGDDVSPCFLVKSIFCTSCSTVIVVGITGIVGYFVHHRWDWCKGVRIQTLSEEPIDRVWTCTEKKVHSI